MKRIQSIFAIAVAIAIVLSFTILPASAEDVYGDVAFSTAWNDTTTDTIKFAKNISVSDLGFNPLKKDLVIDLNGNSLNINGAGKVDNDLYIKLKVDGGNLTIKNGTINLNFKNLSAFHIYSGSVTLENVKVNRGTETITGTSVFEAFGGTVNLSGVSMSNLDHMFNAYNDAKVTSLRSSASTPFTSYAFTANDNSSFTSDNDSFEAKEFLFEINDNSNVSFEKSALNRQGYSGTNSATINGGTVVFNKTDLKTGGLGLFCRAGDITINSGTFISELETTIYIQEDNTHGNVNVTINDGLFKCQNDNALRIDGGNLVINGGEFQARHDNVMIVENQDNLTEGNKVVINGGLFKAEGEQTHDVDHPEWIFNSRAICTNSFQRPESAQPGDYNYYFDLPVIINGGTFKSKYYAAAEFCGNTTITDGEFIGLSAGAILNNTMYGKDVKFTYDITGGHFKGIDRSDVENVDTYATNDDFNGKVSGIFFVERELLSLTKDTDAKIYSKDGIVTTESKMTDFAEDQVAYYTVPEVEIVTPVITDGANVNIEYNKASDTLFKSKVKFDNFDSVKVDGKTVDSKNYTVKAGSTDVTLKASFLKTLATGKHTIQIISDILGNKVVAETTFTVTEAPTPAAEPEAVADTADTNMIGVFAALTALSAVGYVTVKKKED